VAWILFAVPSAQRTQLDAALKDDTISRQSQKVRAAAALGGPSDRTYVLIEGSEDGVRRADALLGPIGERPSPPDAAALYRKFKDEEDAASAGMGLFFGDGA